MRYWYELASWLARSVAHAVESAEAPGIIVTPKGYLRPNADDGDWTLWAGPHGACAWVPSDRMVQDAAYVAWLAEFLRDAWA